MVMRVVTFKLEEELLEALDKLGKRLGKCRSELLREAVMLLVEKHYFHDKDFREMKPRIEKIRIL